MQLGKAVAQYRKEQVQLLWEPPAGYDDFRVNQAWILHGQKGSGKPTLLDYLQFEVGDEFVSIIRPEEGELFRSLVPAILSTNSSRKNVDAISEIVEVLAYAEVMRQLVRDKKFDSGPWATMYDFLVHHRLLEGSVIREALRYLQAATEGFSKPVSSLAGTPDKVDGPTFLQAKTALKKVLKGIDQDRAVLVCLDEIDESGFAYSEEDRIIVNGMLAFCVRSNTALQKEGLPLRFVLSLPSELLNHSEYWDSQKIRSFTYDLHWSDPKKLQNVVNKKIGVELKIHRRHPRFEGDRFSHEHEQTWKRVFPELVESKLARTENAFSYVLRHTFYTPRNVLNCCQRMLDILHDRGHDPGAATVADLTSEEWSQVFQKGVEKYTLGLVKDVLNVYGKIYGNLEATIMQFEGRPNIWSQGALATLLRAHLSDGVVLNADGTRLVGDALLDALYKVGFLGFGSRAPYSDHVPGTSLELSFAFLGVPERPRSWDFAVVAPAFYDYCHVKCAFGIPVVPHERLVLEPKHLLEIGSYDPIGGLNQLKQSMLKGRVE